MKTQLSNLKNLLLLVSLILLFAIKCSTSSKQKTAPVIEQPRPVMEQQVDSLKKVLDEKRKNKTNFK
jgi:hypothetical protein